MKTQFLKLAKVKDEQSFYKLFPNEKSFMAKYGKEVKKLQSAMNGINYQFGQQNNSPGQLGYNLSGDPYKPMYNIGAGQSGMQQLASPSSQQLASTIPTDFNLGKSGGDLLGKLGGVTNLPDKIVGGIQKAIAEKQQRIKAEQWRDVSDVQLQASRTKDIDTNRQLVDNMTKKREMMMPVNTGEEFFPIYGVGTNPLSKNGKKIKGSKKAATGTSAITGFIGGGLDKVTPAIYGDNAGVDLGGIAGETIGDMFGPVGGLIGKQVGQLAGFAFDRNPAKMKKANDESLRNANMMAMSNMGQGIQQQNSSFMEDGGKTSPYQWMQPQVITDFGEHSMRELLRPDSTMNTLRTGGHLQEYSVPSEKALETFDMGGDLQTYWGGYAEPLSDNPYSQSPTVMFRGQSHDDSDGKGRSGIGMTYGNSPVEVERGEPAQEFSDGGQDKSLVVFGNLPISNTLLPLLGDPNAKGKKFKNYIADLSKKELSHNKTIDKSINVINDFTPRTPFEKLTFDSHAANIRGADQNLQVLAEKKQTAAALQQAINDTAEEHGVVVDDLAKGNIKYAKKGISIPKAEYGTDPYKGYTSTREISPEWDNNITHVNDLWNMIDNMNPQGVNSNNHPVINKKNIVSKQKQINKNIPQNKEMTLADMIAARPSSMKLQDPSLKPMLDLPTHSSQDFNIPTSYPRDNVDSKFPWMQVVNSVIPYLRPSNAEQLDPRQIAGETFAMSQNQQESVPLQTFQPQLSTPYNVSFQDKLNANEATFRGAQRTMGYNPAAQTNLAAQQYQANEGVLGEQFRANQAMQNQTYAQNRQTLDNVQLRNLQAYDQQATRQSQAKSNTKEITQAALNSISDKFLKNKLENRTLQTYENEYNYRYDPNMRAQNMNPLAQWNMAGNPKTNVGALRSDLAYSYDSSGNIIGTHPIPKTSKTSRNGSIVNSFKRI